MLTLAQDSYKEASVCEEEGTEDDWLTHYMLGKIAEKKQEKPQVYLEAYKQVMMVILDLRNFY